MVSEDARKAAMEVSVAMAKLGEKLMDPTVTEAEKERIGKKLEDLRKELTRLL